MGMKFYLLFCFLKENRVTQYFMSVVKLHALKHFFSNSAVSFFLAKMFVEIA